MNTTDQAISQIVGKLLHHRELKTLCPQKVAVPSGANIELSKGTVITGVTRAAIVMDAWQDGIGWAVISQGKLHGEGKITIGGDINSAIRPLMSAIQDWSN